jgi:uncharacterized protein GlcG (DUF336 family)
VEDGKVVGAIGIGGGKPDDDDLVARLAVGWTDEIARIARNEK